MIRSVAVLSYHTCPLTVPGVGDAGGMNVSVHEQALSLARRGVAFERMLALAGERPRARTRQA